MKPWFEREQSITEFKEPVVYKGLEINVRKTNVKPPYIATVKSPATGKEVIQKGGNTEQEALDSAKQAVDKREADAPKISTSGQTSILFNTPSNDELLKDPSAYNDFYAKISKDQNGPTLVIGNEIYGAADLEADGFRRSDRRNPKKAGEDALPQVAVNASNKTLSQMGIKMNGRYTMDIEGKYEDDKGHTVYPLQFQSSTIHAGDKERMKRPGLTIGMKREDVEPWFQREFEEAEIIKFPEPVKNVVELPNVQSYPDFLTGVKDLQNRLSKGEISQDSHDRLYQDLIHRFMRKESFETPWFLREQNNSDVGQAAQDLIATANASDDPEYEKETQNLLIKARDFLKKILNQPQTEDVAPQVEQLPKELSGLMSLAKQKFTPEQFKDIQNQLLQSFGRKEREAYEKGKVDQKSESERTKKEINDQIGIMIGKYDQKEGQSEKRRDQIRSFFTSEGISPEDTINFLKLANQGKVIDMVSLVNAGGGKITDHVNPQARAVYDKVHRSFMELQPMLQKGRGNVGSGEIFFIALGQPATKSAKGDLTIPIDGKMQKIEVKSSKWTYKKDKRTGKVSKGPSGGRFSGDAIANPLSLQKEFSGLLKDTFGVSGYNPDGRFVYNINKTVLNILNKIILDKKIPREKIVNFVKKLLDLWHKNVGNKTLQIAEKMVNSDGTLDTELSPKFDKNGKKVKDNKFVRGMTYTNFISYQKSNKFDAILSFNMDGQTYEFVKNGNELAKKISNGSIKTFGTIDLNDKSSDATFQIFTNP